MVSISYFFFFQPHPNLFELIYCLKKEECNNRLEINALKRGDSVKYTSNKYRVLEKKYIQQKISLENGEITPLEFVDNLKYHINLI